MEMPFSVLQAARGNVFWGCMSPWKPARDEIVLKEERIRNLGQKVRGLALDAMLGELYTPVPPAFVQNGKEKS